jgi:hypothetical protein
MGKKDKKKRLDINELATRIAQEATKENPKPTDTNQQGQRK